MIKAGIDLGAGTIRVVTEEEGLVWEQPDLAAFDKRGRLLAIGQEAHEMQKMDQEDVSIRRPFHKNGNVDFETLDAILEELCWQLGLFKMFAKTILILSYPTTMQQEQCQQLKDHLLKLGAWRVYFDQEIWISAIGAQLDLFLPVASCVLNMGEQSSDIAVFSNGRIQAIHSAQSAGRQARRLIRSWIRKNKGLNLSSSQLEQILRQLGCVQIHPDPLHMEITGQDLSGKMRKASLTENDIAQALEPAIREWGSWIEDFLTSLTKDQQEDIRLRGIVCCGGIMRLDGLDRYLANRLNCPVYVTDDPVHTVSHGLSILISRLD